MSGEGNHLGMATNPNSTKWSQRCAGAMSIQPYFCDAADETMDLARPSLDFIASSPLASIANHEAFRGATWRLPHLMRWLRDVSKPSLV